MDSITKTKIIENAFLAKLASLKLKKPSIAMVWGSKILLYGISKADFLKNEQWIKHEMAHVRQFQEHGFVLFLFRYIYETMKNGYYNNKFEVEARKAETE